MKHAKVYIRYTLSFAIMALFMYLAFRGQDFEAIWISLTRVRFVWIFYLTVGGILSHVVRAWRWQYLLIPIKKNVTLRNSFSAVMIGYMVNNFLPRVGEVVRPYTLGKLEGISKSAAFGTVIIERIIDIITFFSILLAVMFFYSDSFAELFPSFASIKPYFLGGSVLAFLLFIGTVFQGGVHFFDHEEGACVPAGEDPRNTRWAFRIVHQRICHRERLPAIRHDHHHELHHPGNVSSIDVHPVLCIQRHG